MLLSPQEKGDAIKESLHSHLSRPLLAKVNLTVAESKLSF